MKKILLLAGCFALTAFQALAQVGAPYIHDPSTLAECDGKYYTFGTGGGGLISADGWVWEGGAVRPGGGAAPDVIQIGDRYLVGYTTSGGGLGGNHDSRVVTMWNKTLDPSSPDFAFTEPVEVAHSEADEDCDAIDISFLMTPEGRLFCTYGTYFGHIRLIELDPATGGRLPGNRAVDIAIDCEATKMMYRDGWYYLLGTHGTCCDGVNSTYNIVVGRSRCVTGPFLDNMGRDMLRGGGKMVIAAEERLFGAGHFGPIVEETGVEKMSLHFESWPSVPCSGKTAGRKPESRSGKGITRFSPAGAAMPWSWWWTLYGPREENPSGSSRKGNRWWPWKARNWKTWLPTGRRGPSPCVWETTWPVRTRNGPLNPSPKPEDTWEDPIIRFCWKEPAGPWPPQKAPPWSQCRPLPEPPTSSGALTSSPTAPTGLCPGRFPAGPEMTDCAWFPWRTARRGWESSTSAATIANGI